MLALSQAARSKLATSKRSVAPVDASDFIAVGAMLAGGQSSRFGTDKSLAPLHSYRGDGPLGVSESPATELPTTMGGVVLQALRSAGCDPVLVVGGTSGGALGVPTIPDRSADLGPLSGLASTLQWVGRGWVLVVPCDLPLLRGETLLPLLRAAAAHAQAGTPTAVIGMHEGRPQPSVGCWPASFGHGLASSVRSGERRLRSALDLVPWEGLDLAPGAFRDADNPEALRTLLSEAERR